MVKIVPIKTRSTGRMRTNLTERRRPLGPCHTASPAAAASITADSNRGRSGVASPTVVVVVVEVVSTPEVERRDLLELEKHRQPPDDDELDVEPLDDWLRLRFRVGLLSRSCSAKHFW